MLFAVLHSLGHHEYVDHTANRHTGHTSVFVTLIYQL